MEATELRASILDAVRAYYRTRWPDRAFRPGIDPVPVSGRVFDAEEIVSLVDASLDFWLTTGRYAERFEREFAEYMGVRFVSLVNSGSSANLLALSALCSPLLKERRLEPGDEVITVAAGFPTTLNPIIQNRLVPVFVDVTIPTYNVDVSQLEDAVGPRTKAVFLAHTLGNPFDLDAVKSLCDRHNLWLIEDACDAVGAEWDGRKVGSFGDLATVSFYPAHHITMGEGGAVLTSNPELKRTVESLRDWGRDCWCPTGHDNTCGKRFSQQHGALPFGYDHKYVYSQIGYNLKLTDMQAAVGVAQLAKLPEFVSKRRENYAFLREALADLDEFLVLPETLPKANPNWFGFPITLTESCLVSRRDLLVTLNERKIGTRLLFGGNLLRQPAYREMRHRIPGSLDRSDLVMRRTFWVGVYPGLTQKMCLYLAESIRHALGRREVSK